MLVAVDPGAGLSPADLVAAWEGDEQARALGPAGVEAAPPGGFFPDVLTLVVIPLAVNVASTAACALVSRLAARLHSGPRNELRVEVSAPSGGDGDLLVVVRVAGEHR